MILDGLLENDDLLEDEIQEAEQDGFIDEDDSQERTISEQVIPISHQMDEAPVNSLSPSSKRLRRSNRLLGPEKFGAGPLAEEEATKPNKNDSKKSVPRGPLAYTAASRKLKTFHTKSSPKKRSIPSASGLPSNDDNNIPHYEVATSQNNKSKKSDTKALKPKDGVEESRISPDPPA